MKASTRFAVLAVALVSGSSLALAAQSNDKIKNTTQSVAAPVAPATPEGLSTSDKVSLTSKQQSAAWRDITQQARKEEPPANFTAKVGAVVPSTLMTYPVPMTASDEVPSLRRYQYALLKNNKLLIINPNDEKVADVITH